MHPSSGGHHADAQPSSSRQQQTAQQAANRTAMRSLPQASSFKEVPSLIHGRSEALLARILADQEDSSSSPSNTRAAPVSRFFPRAHRPTPSSTPLSYENAISAILSETGPNLANMKKPESKEVRYILYSPDEKCLAAFHFNLHRGTHIVYLISWLQRIIDRLVLKEGYKDPLLLDSVIFKHIDEAESHSLPPLKGDVRMVAFVQNGEQKKGATHVTWEVDELGPYWNTFRDMMLIEAVPMIDKPIFKITTTYYASREGTNSSVEGGHQFVIRNDRNTNGIYTSQDYLGHGGFEKLVDEAAQANALMPPRMGGNSHRRGNSFYSAPIFQEHAQQQAPGPAVARSARRIEAGQRAVEMATLGTARRMANRSREASAANTSRNREDSAATAAEEAKAALWPQQRRRDSPEMVSIPTEKTVHLTLQGQPQEVQVPLQPATSNNRNNIWNKYQRAGGNPDRWAAFPMEYPIYNRDDSAKHEGGSGDDEKLNDIVTPPKRKNEEKKTETTPATTASKNTESPVRDLEESRRLYEKYHLPAIEMTEEDDAIFFPNGDQPARPPIATPRMHGLYRFKDTRFCFGANTTVPIRDGPPDPPDMRPLHPAVFAQKRRYENDVDTQLSGAGLYTGGALIARGAGQEPYTGQGAEEYFKPGGIRDQERAARAKSVMRPTAPAFQHGLSEQLLTPASTLNVNAPSFAHESTAENTIDDPDDEIYESDNFEEVDEAFAGLGMNASRFIRSNSGQDIPILTLTTENIESIPISLDATGRPYANYSHISMASDSDTDVGQMVGFSDNSNNQRWPHQGRSGPRGTTSDYSAFINPLNPNYVGGLHVARPQQRPSRGLHTPSAPPGLSRNPLAGAQQQAYGSEYTYTGRTSHPRGHAAPTGPYPFIPRNQRGGHAPSWNANNQLRQTLHSGSQTSLQSYTGQEAGDNDLSPAQQGQQAQDAQLGGEALSQTQASSVNRIGTGLGRITSRGSAYSLRGGGGFQQNQRGLMSGRGNMHNRRQSLTRYFEPEDEEEAAAIANLRALAEGSAQQHLTEKIMAQTSTAAAIGNAALETVYAHKCNDSSSSEPEVRIIGTTARVTNVTDRVSGSALYLALEAFGPLNYLELDRANVC